MCRVLCVVCYVSCVMFVMRGAFIEFYPVDADESERLFPLSESVQLQPPAARAWVELAA